MGAKGDREHLNTRTDNTPVSLLPQGINQYGVSRMCRLLAVLQPALSSLGTAGGAFRPESARAFEKARAYYGLLTVPTDALLRAAAERPTRFTATEYTAMLQVNLTRDRAPCFWQSNYDVIC